MKLTRAVLAMVVVVGMSEVTLLVIAKLQGRTRRWQQVVAVGMVVATVVELVFRYGFPVY